MFDCISALDGYNIGQAILPGAPMHFDFAETHWVYDRIEDGEEAYENVPVSDLVYYLDDENYWADQNNVIRMQSAIQDGNFYPYCSDGQAWHQNDFNNINFQTQE